MQQGQPQKFEDTPEAQEYIGKLQAKREELPEGASSLEREMLRNLIGLQGKVREMTTAQGDIDKQIVRLQNDRESLKSEIAVVSGEMAGYAKMLVSAEGSRRAEAAAEKQRQIDEEKAATESENQRKADAKRAETKAEEQRKLDEEAARVKADEEKNLADAKAKADEERAKTNKTKPAEPGKPELDPKNETKGPKPQAQPAA